MTALRAELRPFRLALRSAYVAGKVSVRFRAGFLVSLTAGGCTGWGEASPLPGWSRTTLLQTEAALRRGLHDMESPGNSAARAVLASLQEAPHARAGIAGAWFDLRARQAGRTLAEFLSTDSGAAPASSVTVNGLVPAAAPLGVEQAARAAAEAGFAAVKLKVGAAEPPLDIDRIRAARAGMGPGLELRLDANGAWDESTALDVLGRVQDCDIAFCEEPVNGIEAIAAVGKRSAVPVAVDESVRSEADAERALALGVRIVVVKPQALGGPDVALAIAARAREAGASVVVTSFLDSTVGLAHALHVAACVDSTSARPPAHGLATASLLAQDVVEPLPVVSGAMRLPLSPGLGVSPSSELRPPAPGA